jgi:hypothetical protein
LKDENEQKKRKRRKKGQAKHAGLGDTTLLGHKKA